MSKLVFAIDDFSVVKSEIDYLIKKNWEDLATDKDKIKLNPNWGFYETLNSAGYLGIYTARSDGKLVGYFIAVATEHPHFRDHIFASNDVLYLDPDYRKGLAGYRLIKFVEDDLRAKGVSALTITTKVHKPFDPVLERLGFNLAERVYSKYLGE